METDMYTQRYRVENRAINLLPSTVTSWAIFSYGDDQVFVPYMIETSQLVQIMFWCLTHDKSLSVGKR